MSKRLVYEVGIIRGGIPIVRKQYIESSATSTDSMLIGGILDALINFVNETFRDSAEEFKMANYHVYIERVVLCKEKLLMYALCGTGKESGPVRNALAAIVERLSRDSWTDKIKFSNLNAAQYTVLYPVIDENILPLNLSYAERARSKLKRF